MIELRERLLHARSNKEKNQILDELHKLYTENPEDAKDFLNSTAVEFGAAAHSMAAKKELAKILKIVPGNYIAKEYFGKSGAWFSQRLNGHVINNSRAYFSHDDLLKIQDAIQDIGRKLADFRFSDDVINHI